MRAGRLSSNVDTHQRNDPASFLPYARPKTSAGKGLAGIAHFHLDGYRFTQQQRYLDAYDTAVHGLDVLEIARAEGLAFPGLYWGRINCDHETGSAGVVTALTRRANGRACDLTLDDHFVAVAAPALV